MDTPTKTPETHSVTPLPFGRQESMVPEGILADEQQHADELRDWLAD